MRIYKGSEITLRLYNPCKIEDGLVDVVLYTTNPKLAYKIKDATVEGNIVYVKIDKFTFNNMEDGVINYIILDEVYNTERQSSYYLKTPDDYIAKSVQTSKDVYIVDNGDYKILPDEDYTSIEEVNVHVEFDAEPYIQRGFELGEENQKSKLESVSITENGIYTREDGYNEIHVEVPDLNGDYQTGYDEGYEAGIDYASENAGEIVAQTARVLNITENGYYLSQYSDPVLIYPELVTGDFGDGTYFYDYGEIIDGCYDTKISPTANSRIEFWYKPAEKSTGYHYQNIFGCGYVDGNENTFDLKYSSNNRDKLELRIGNKRNTFTFNNQIWNHFIIDNGTLWLNGEELFTLDLSTYVSDGSSILINSVQGRPEYFANGLFGMFKIDSHIFIPSETGFINYNTGEELGGYVPPTSNVNYTYNETDTTNITGYFDDGTEFKNYAKLDAVYFATNIQATPNSRIEFWYRNNKFDKDYYTIIGAQDSSKFIFKVCEKNKTEMAIEYGSLGSNPYSQNFKFPYDNNWHHFIMSKADGLVLDGIKQFDLTGSFTSNVSYPYFYINCSFLDEKTSNANGEIGMIKIDDNIFIPTEKGFINYKTNELLSSNWVYSDEEIPFIGEYHFTENEIIEYEPEGNLIKTAYVNVPPKLSDRKINFAYSTFDKIPDGLINWKKITDINSMFRECSQLKDLGDIDTSNIVYFKYAFYGCTQLADFSKINLSNATSLYNAFGNTKIDNDVINNFDTSNVIDLSYAFYGTPITYFPSINTSNVTTFKGIFENSMDLEEVHPIDTSKATDLSYMFYNFSSEHKLRKLPEFDCTNVTSIGNMFSYYQDRMDYFTDCGGWKNLKINWSDNYGLRACANLSYESCINILNGLWDFRGNGDTTTTKTLKVHQNFLNTVGDEVSIAIDKGWNITA